MCSSINYYFYNFASFFWIRFKEAIKNDLHTNSTHVHQSYIISNFIDNDNEKKIEEHKMKSETEFTKIRKNIAIMKKNAILNGNVELQKKCEDVEEYVKNALYNFPDATTDELLYMLKNECRKQNILEKTTNEQ